MPTIALKYFNEHKTKIDYLGFIKYNKKIYDWKV